MLVRLLYENLLWQAALLEHGSEFVADMREDEIFNRKVLCELAVKFGEDVNAPEALALRGTIKELARQFSKPKKLKTSKTAVEGAVETAYFDYMRLSLNAMHCSVTALSRHLSIERRNGRARPKLSLVAGTGADEVLSTILHACWVLIATAECTDELTGCTTADAPLAALQTEFVGNDWLDRMRRGGLYG